MKEKTRGRGLLLSDKGPWLEALLVVRGGWSWVIHRSITISNFLE